MIIAFRRHAELDSASILPRPVATRVLPIGPLREWILTFVRMTVERDAAA